MSQSSPRPRSAAALVALAWLSGCAGPLSGALDEFRDARYPEAVIELRRLEPESRGWSARERARYALYRGLTHLALGDARPADLWLGLAKALAEAHPGALDAAERGRLLSGWQSLGHMPGEESVRLVQRRIASGT
ncbi:MAG: hypothetical protein OZ921_08390 [Sorangiineae bacterium]|nr:hypothetical protein [Polyangiaceae bacterium]MEB2322518.1 hypothetical protein [Sorangiineae bacterium]